MSQIKEAIKLVKKVKSNLWDYTSPNVNVKNEKLSEDIELLDQALAIFCTEPEPIRKQPCGCILCVCDTEDRCLGCGAKMCEKHQKIGYLPKEEMVYPEAPEQPPAGEFTIETRIFEGQMWVNARDWNKLQARLDRSEASREELLAACERYIAYRKGADDSIDAIAPQIEDAIAKEKEGGTSAKDGKTK